MYWSRMVHRNIAALHNILTHCLKRENIMLEKMLFVQMGTNVGAGYIAALVLIDLASLLIG